MRPFAIMLAAAMLLPLSAGAAFAQGRAMTYAPGTSQYRITSVVTQSSEAMGEQEVRTTQLLTVQIERGTADTLRVQMTVDSVDVQSPAGAGATVEAQNLVGVRMSGSMSPRGRVFALAPPAEMTDDAVIANLVLSLQHFLVMLPPAVRGESWTDTTDANLDTEETDIRRRTITRASVTGDTTYAGQRAQRIQQTSTVVLSGTVASGGMTLVLSGTGTGTSTHFVTSNGVYLGATSEQQTSLEFEFAGNTMPVLQRATSTVERIR
jgi:hypothetical protein